MSSAYSRADVKTHYGQDRPAVNVKVHDTLEDGWRKFEQSPPETIEPGFSLAWIEEHMSERDLDALFWMACEFDFEMIQADAVELLGVRPDDVERDGRMGGWVVVTGLPPIEDWDAIQLAKWRKFERWSRETADYIMGHVCELVYLNDYPAWKARGRGLRRASMLAAV